MQLPEDFIQEIRPVFGEERFERFVKALDGDSPVSIRLNPAKAADMMPVDGEPIPWCRDGYYLPKRPNFTFDPLLHAGCYYVQEASSMFLDEVLKQLAISQLPIAKSQKLMALDLCAAPGGKSTLLRAVLPTDSVLYSNEPIAKRASILLENITKWGYANHHVTNLYPKDYRKSKMMFDLILCDVPCSGEGMFRKDPDSVKEWSLQNVEKCWQLQREIVADAWQCLNEGGILIYSTCTYNIKEDEENVRWIRDELGAELIPVATKPEWGITGSLLDGFDEPVYRFIPGYTRGEGLFMAVMRKGKPMVSATENGGFCNGKRCFLGQKTLVSPTETIEKSSGSPCVELTYPQAIAYLRGEALVLPSETPRGMVEVSFMGHPLGFVKNIGSRANNQYPKEWRIKTTHVPHSYEPVLQVKHESL
jgi:16S rRNA C967 or C1407 C5-methylase (RsmB/RsmF family)